MKTKTKGFIIITTIAIIINTILLFISYEIFPQNYFFDGDSQFRLIITTLIGLFVGYFYDSKHERVLFKK